MRNKQKIVVLLLSLLFLSGCLDREEIEKRAYVIGIGLDKGHDNMIRITYLIPNPEYASQAQGGSGDVPSREIITMEANDLITMKNRANTVIAKSLTYDQLQIIAVSEELAKDKNFIRYMYDATKDVEIRRDVNLIITREGTDEYFKKNRPKLELRAHKFFNLMIDRGSETGLIPPNSELLQYFRIMEAGSDLFLAIYSTSEDGDHSSADEKNKILAGELAYSGSTNNTQFAGGAVFKDGVMVGKMTGEEVRIANLLNNTMNAADILDSYPDPFNKKQQLAIKINKVRKNHVKMNLKAERPIIEVTVPLSLEVLSDHSMTDYGIEKNRTYLQKELTKTIHDEMMAFIKKTQTDFKAQPFGWSLNARRKFSTLPAYIAYDFAKKYPDMEVRLKLDVSIDDYGRQKNVPQIKGVTPK